MGEKVTNKTKLVGTYRDLDVYKMALEGAIRIFELTKTFPPEEKFSLVDQIRRSSRSVCANIGESWRKRRYIAAFVSKLSDAETEACPVKYIDRHLTGQQKRKFGLKWHFDLVI
jgi:four helix bundle protein